MSSGEGGQVTGTKDKDKDKDTYLSAYYRRVMRRQGKQKAITALTHKILVIAWNLLSTGALYDDPGAAALRKTTGGSSHSADSPETVINTQLNTVTTRRNLGTSGRTPLSR